MVDSLETFLQTTNSFEIKISEESKLTDRYEERWGVRGRAKWFVFGVSGGASDEIIEKQTVTETQSIKFTFANIQSFTVDRGSWYQAGIISRFRDRMRPGFWGLGGRLNLIPTSLILVRGATIEITTSSEVSDYFYNKHTAGGGGGFSIGPFSFGSRASSETIRETSEIYKTETGFTLADTSGRGQVLAVTSIRNQDLLADARSVQPIYSSMSREDLEIGQRLVEEARQQPGN